MDWQNNLSPREKSLLANCRLYTANDPAGLPGHDLAQLITKLANLLDNYTATLTEYTTELHITEE